jgi:acyl carrier protein
MEIEYKLRELLMPVLGIANIDEIQPSHALVNDLGAESIDFVEILYLIETHFGVKIQIQEITMVDYASVDTSVDGKVTQVIAEKLNRDFKTDKFHEGQSVRDIYENFTVGYLATIISLKTEKPKQEA